MIGHRSVRIPVTARTRVNQLHKPDTPFNKSSGCKTLPSETVVRPSFHAIQRQRFVGLTAHVECRWHFGLHAMSRFKRLDPGRQLRVVLTSRQMNFIERSQGIQFQFLTSRRRDSTGQIGDGFRARHDSRSLMSTRQEVRRPDLSPRIRHLRCQHQKRRQVLVRRSQPVTHPRSDTRTGKRE